MRACWTVAFVLAGLMAVGAVLMHNPALFAFAVGYYIGLLLTLAWRIGRTLQR